MIRQAISRMLATGTGTGSGRLRTLGMCLLLGAGVGCTPQGAQNTSRDDLLAPYEAGRYEQAYEAAAARANSGSRADRAQARYIAGASAFELGRYSEAARHLRPLSSHNDAELAGQANAMLGLIHTRRGEHEQAINYLRRSAQQMSGEDRAHAYYHLALAEQRLGRWTQARTSLSNAMNHSSDAAFRREVRDRIATTGFTLQLNAFESRSNAEQHARQMRSATARAGLGSPRVVRASTPEGGTLHLVQVGSFASYDSALRARRALGRTDVIIAVMRGGPE